MSAMERIYADPDGKVLRQPAVAPSGDAIAFVRVMDEIGSHYQLWVVNANGSDPRRLTTGYDDRHPAWSSDGRIIIFRRRKFDGGVYSGGSVAAVSADGGMVTELWTDEAGFLYAHTWIR